jgi:NAD dependent epimerase/dehydratase
MDWAKTRVLITGAGGFIGSHLTEELVRRGAEVRAMVRYNSRNDRGNLELLPREIQEKLEVVSGDVRDPFFVDEAVRGTAVVFHLAALITIPYSYIAPQSYVETNVTGTLNVLQAARRHSVVKVVHTSTSEIYGTALYTPIDEKHPAQAQSPYSASKIGGDKIAESFFRSFDLPVATVRPFNTFGPRQSARAVIPTIISQALWRDGIELGSLTPVRDLTFVGDTVDAFIRVAEVAETAGEVINVGRGSGLTINDLVQRIFSLLDVTRPVVTTQMRVRPANSEVFNLICDNSKARNLIGWEPKTSLDDGLRAVITWMRDHSARFKADIYNV